MRGKHTHYDEHGKVASIEEIKLGKRERVLHLINQANIGEEIG
jgi:hypothetical protein